MDKGSTEGLPTAGRSQLPKLVINWANILNLARQGYLDLLKMSIEHSVKEGTAKLVPADPPELDDVPPPIILSAPVVQATWGGKTDVVRYFVESFSDIVIAEDEISLPPCYISEDLHCCFKSEDPRNYWQDIVGHRHGPHFASHIAASRGYVDILQLWGRSCTRWRDDFHRTPLHWAAFNGQIRAVEYLLEVGAGVNEANIDEVTPVMECAYQLSCVMQTRDCGPYIKTIACLLENGAIIEDSHIEFYLGVAMEMSTQLTEDEFDCLPALVACTNKTGMIFIARLFAKHTAGQDGVTSKNFTKFFIGFLYFMSFASDELDQVSMLWQCALKLEAEQRAEHQAMEWPEPQLSLYENREAFNSWFEAEAIISQAEHTGNGTEVIYLCAIMLERYLGPRNPFVFKSLFHLPLSLNMTYSSSVAPNLFLHSLQLFREHLVVSDITEVEMELFSPLQHLDEFGENTKVSDAELILEILVETLELVHREVSARGGDSNLSQWHLFISTVALGILFRTVQLLSRDPGFGDDLTEKMDEFGLRLVSMVSPCQALLCMVIYTYQLSTDQNKYRDLVLKYVLSWIARSGALYTLNSYGYTVFSYNLPEKMMVLLASEIGLHHDAIDGVHRTVHTRVSDEKFVKLKAVFGEPATVPLLACLSARAIIAHHISYQAEGCLPQQIVKFVSIHDPKRPRNVLISHDIQKETDFEAITLRVPLFSTQ